MNAATDMSFTTYANAFDHGLSLEALRERAPAVFATSAHEHLSARYNFLPSERLLSGLMSAGFIPVDARQTRTRRASPLYARHVVRLRRRLETVQLPGYSVPEVVFLNSHDGTSGLLVTQGVFRLVCSNGLILSRGAFPGYCVSHRGNVVDEVIAAALKVCERFDELAAQIERMEQRRMLKDEQLAFAERALDLRFPNAVERGMEPAQLLTCRRIEDLGDDLFRVMNRVQEHLCRGGLARRSTTGRLTHTRGITSIKRDVTLNRQLWDLALGALAA